VRFGYARACRVPVTVKCRIGIDDQDAEDDLQKFIETVAAAGCITFIVHARKAWLAGLSPKQNREVPPLDYARVYRLKASRPDLTIVLNGGIAGLDDTRRIYRHASGFFGHPTHCSFKMMVWVFSSMRTGAAFPVRIFWTENLTPVARSTSSGNSLSRLVSRNASRARLRLSIFL